MNEDTVRKWIQKADNDFKTGLDELAAEDPATDTVCFHMQQCAEKYLKAFLVFHGREIRRTHDIAELIEMCKSVDAGFDNLLGLQVDELTKYAIDVRYPDDFYFPPFEEAQKATESTRQVRDFVAGKLRV